MLIQNEAIKSLLLEKKPLVEEGRKINAEIEAEGRKIVDAELVKKGVKVKKDTYSGSYRTLEEAFGVAAQSVYEGLIQSQLKEKIEALQSLQNKVMAINERVSDIITSEVMATLNLGEFEYPTNIELTEKGIEITVEDALEVFKENYRKVTKK